MSSPPGPRRGFRLTRRRFLLAAPAALAGAAVAGAVGSRLLESPFERQMRAMGADVMLHVKRGHHPGRSGEVQVVPQAGSTVVRGDVLPRDVRTSHPLPWRYITAVPLILYGPDHVAAGASRRRVTLADLAPTYGRLVGSLDFDAPDGRPLADGLVDDAPATPPRVIVTVVLDGGGWNALRRWPDAWPNIARLRRDGGTFDNATTGSAPAVTASVHATIGTGAFPSRHGISGHWIWLDGEPTPAYRNAADPAALLLPTLGDVWQRETGNRAWVGLVGYQDWHLGMLGHGAAFEGNDPQFLMAWDRDAPARFGTLGSEAYRYDETLVPASRYDEYQEELARSADGRRLFPDAGHVHDAECCTPPVARFQTDVIEALLREEGLGRRDVTDLLFVNFKVPDYAGHTFGLASPEHELALRGADEQVGRIRALLDEHVGDGRYVLCVTADHGQCPAPEEVGGLKIGLEPLANHVTEYFLDKPTGRSPIRWVQPGEVFVDRATLRDLGRSLDDVSRYLGEYSLSINRTPERAPDSLPADRIEEPVFAAVLDTELIQRTGESEIRALGRQLWPRILGDAP